MVHAIIQKVVYFEDSYTLVPINYIKALVQSKFYDAHDYNMHRVSKYCICTNGVSIIYTSMLSKIMVPTSHLEYSRISLPFSAHDNIRNGMGELYKHQGIH
jgi:hypothetical protein